MKQMNSPRATILYKVFDILHCDANYLFQDEMKELIYRDQATPEEFENIIKKYRALDTFGQNTILYLLDRELTRVKSIKGKLVAESEKKLLHRRLPAEKKCRIIQFYTTCKNCRMICH